MNIGFINVNSVCNKLQILSDFVIESKLDLLGLAETWLVPEILDSYISIRGYCLVRCDTTSGVRKHGVCLYLRSCLLYTSPSPRDKRQSRMPSSA